jgi:hypothetical protein
MRVGYGIAFCGGLVCLLSGCAEVEEVADRGAAEGRVLWQRLNTWLNELDPQADGPAGADEGGARPRPEGGARPRPEGDAAAAPDPTLALARERFLASYALLGCIEAAAPGTLERERRRAELLRALGYTDFDWLRDVQRFGKAEGEALRALCRP